jgi:FHA domain
MVSANSSGSSFLRELKRRKVVRTSIYYILVCWVALQVGDIVFPAMGLDDEKASRVLLLLVILGFPLNFLFAWYFQLTPKGVVRTTSFVERRILKNMAPINDRRHSRVSNYFQKEPEEQEYNWIISAETGLLTGLSFGIAKTTELGRSLDCDIAIVSPQVSRQHARLELEGDKLIVEDLGSANGTVVNGKTIEGRHILRHEDELRLHDVIFRVTESYSGSSKEQDTMNQTTFIDPGEAANTPDDPEK